MSPTRFVTRHPNPSPTQNVSSGSGQLGLSPYWNRVGRFGHFNRFKNSNYRTDLNTLFSNSLMTSPSLEHVASGEPSPPLPTAFSSYNYKPLLRNKLIRSCCPITLLSHHVIIWALPLHILTVPIFECLTLFKNSFPVSSHFSFVLISSP